MTDPQAECLECAAEIPMSDDVQPGEIITCEECGIDLEVVEVDDHHVVFTLAPEEEEDWGE